MGCDFMMCERKECQTSTLKEDERDVLKNELHMSRSSFF